MRLCVWTPHHGVCVNLRKDSCNTLGVMLITSGHEPHQAPLADGTASRWVSGTPTTASLLVDGKLLQVLQSHRFECQLVCSG